MVDFFLASFIRAGRGEGSALFRALSFQSKGDRLYNDRRQGERVMFQILSSCLLVLLAPELEFPAELVQFTAYEKNPVLVASGPPNWDAKIRERGWIRREDGGYRLWFTGYDGRRDAPKHVGYAQSKDGLAWQRALEPQTKDGWVEDVMIVKDRGVYYMFAEGENDRAHLLTSIDGLTWREQGTLDIREPNGDPIAPGPFGTPTAWVREGRWHLLFERRDQGVWLATSTDLKRWTKVAANPVLEPGPGPTDSRMIAVNQLIRYRGIYYVYYHGRGNEPLWSTHIAASNDLLTWKKHAGNPLLPIKANKSSGMVVHDGTRFRLYTMHDRVDVHFGPPCAPDEPP